jgi:hypothetical protein
MFDCEGEGADYMLMIFEVREELEMDSDEE